MNGAQYILKFLEEQGVGSVFGYPGGAIMPLYDALLDSPIQHYLARHEQGAAFSAIGFARSTNQVGVCIGTSGPGATNLLTSLADAKLDSVPLLAITGQVATSAMGTDAFQEVDVLGLSLSICKHSMLIDQIKELPQKLLEAYELAIEGRPGPVLVDIPKDVLLAEINKPVLLKTEQSLNGNQALLSAQIEEANRLLQQANKPLAYIGGGIGMANALPELRLFLEQSQIPAVSTLKGLGSVPKDYSFNLGMLGMHGLPAANLAVQQCDLLLVLGARLDDRATGKLAEFAPEATVIHIDIDQAELGKRRFAQVAIEANIKTVLPFLESKLLIEPWQQHVSDLMTEKRFIYGKEEAEQISAPNLLRTLSNKLPQDSIVCCDVGQHQMWVAQHMQFSSPARHLSSGGLGTMGFGMPAAIGAKIANPESEVIAVCGDGSFMMNMQELATIKRYDVPVKILVLDNQRLGMVKQWQELFNEERYSETDLSDNPEFTQLAEVFGLKSKLIEHPSEISDGLDFLLNQAQSTLLHVRLNSIENVWPIVPPNTANDKMWEQSQCTQ